MNNIISFKTFIDEETEYSSIIAEGFNIIKTLIDEHYTIGDDIIEISESQNIVLDIILDHYYTNIESSSFESLYEELENIILDESIGSIVANLVHGTGKERRRYVKRSNDVEVFKSRSEQNPDLYVKKTTPKSNTVNYVPVFQAKQDKHQENIKNGAYSGMLGGFRKRKTEKDIYNSRKQFEKYQSTLRKKEHSADVANQELKNKEKGNVALSYKIDRALRPKNIVKGIAKGIGKGIGMVTRKAVGLPNRRYKRSYQSKYEPYYNTYYQKHHYHHLRPNHY